MTGTVHMNLPLYGYNATVQPLTCQQKIGKEHSVGTERPGAVRSVVYRAAMVVLGDMVSFTWVCGCGCFLCVSVCVSVSMGVSVSLCVSVPVCLHVLECRYLYSYIVLVHYTYMELLL